MKKKRIEFPPMTDNELERMHEIQFYLVIKALAIYLTDAYNMYEYIELVARHAKCNISIIKGCVADIADGVQSKTMPSKIELAVSLYRMDCPLFQIQAVTQMSYQTIYNRLKQYQKDLPYFPPRFSTPQREQIIQFLEFYYKLHIKL